MGLQTPARQPALLGLEDNMPLGIGKVNEARDHKKLNKKLSRAWKKVAKEHEKSTGEQGYYCTKLVEPVPMLNKAE